MTSDQEEAGTVVALSGGLRLLHQILRQRLELPHDVHRLREALCVTVVPGALQPLEHGRELLVERTRDVGRMAALGNRSHRKEAGREDQRTAPSGLPIRGPHDELFHRDLLESVVVGQLAVESVRERRLSRPFTLFLDSLERRLDVCEILDLGEPEYLLLELARGGQPRLQVMECAENRVVEVADGRKAAITDKRHDRDRAILRNLDFHEGLHDDVAREAHEVDGEPRYNVARQPGGILRYESLDVYPRLPTDRSEHVTDEAHVEHLLANHALDDPADRVGAVGDRPHRAQIGRNRREFELDRVLEALLDPGLIPVPR